MSSITLLPSLAATPSTAGRTGNRIWPALLSSSVALLLAATLFRHWHANFHFDDAYMYCRYAGNFRHGWGISWNPGGPHTFGVTSVPWFFVVLAGSYLVGNAAMLLTGASCVTGLLALAVLSVVAARRCTAPLLRNAGYLFCSFVLLLLLNRRFAYNWANGMETMLAMLTVTLLLEAVLRLREKPRTHNLLPLILCGILCAWTRPELALLAVALPCAAILQPSRPRNLRTLLLYLGGLGAGLALLLFCNWRYFGTPVPLAFYLKAMHGYDGYRLLLNPWGATAIFISLCLPALVILLLCTCRQHLPMVATCLIPVALMLLYLATVLQVMGTQARYYLPLLPLVFYPAIRVLDDALTRGSWQITPRRLLLACCSLLLFRDYTQQVTHWIGNRLSASRQYYPKPVFLPAVAPTLPLGDLWQQSTVLSSNLPAGTTLAATEVGMLGASAPQINILDMAGLNDAHMARHPLDVDYVLNTRHPDVIWLPHADYTRIYGLMTTAPQLLRDYDVYQGALLFGWAIRRQSLADPAFRAAIQHAWSTLYPGFPMERYRVQTIHWDPHPTLHGNGEDVADDD